MSGLTLFQHFVAEVSRIQYWAIQSAQHRSHSGFAGCNSSGQSHTQHQRGMAATPERWLQP